MEEGNEEHREYGEEDATPVAVAARTARMRLTDCILKRDKS